MDPEEAVVVSYPPMLIQRWPIVCDVGLAFNQHWINVSWNGWEAYSQISLIEFRDFLGIWLPKMIILPMQSLNISS